ncbi:hypothetical protein OEZ85_013997 [Tetradesmus obliquus]|uniref:Uncharacterized protein n=1 Tax=Tetradesmus obliquus TaxID=3088 RepID=A0ABY8U6T4_TETOB|nr:hypothetical protein OEZ85_013997 [Tetradesmus obliquus]
MGLLQQLPAGLRELRLGMDRSQSASLGRDVHHEVDADEGAIKTYFPGDAQVRKARRQQPLDLSHLRALTKLQLSAAVPLLSDDKLPVSLLHLHARECFSLQPLLHLSSLEVLALRPNTVPGSQLLALTQLTALQEVKLFYEGGYYPQGDWLEWDEQLLQQHAAVWPKLPLRSLGFYEDSGLYHRRDEYSWQESLLPKECVLAAAQLTGLTHLALEGTIGRKGLLQVVQQLTGLRHLSLWWDWMTQYFDNDGYEQGDYTQEERQQAAGDVLTVMRAIDEGLPRLQHLNWLCDTIRTKSADERMSLDRVALQHVLQELEDEAPDCVQMQQLHYAGKIWLNKE